MECGHHLDRGWSDAGGVWVFDRKGEDMIRYKEPTGPAQTRSAGCYSRNY
jgi:hypothetical protein